MAKPELVTTAVTPEELELLNAIRGAKECTRTRDASERYEELDRDTLALCCALKDQARAQRDNWLRQAREVIDDVAEIIGLEPGCGLYNMDGDDHSILGARIGEWVDKSGEKVKLKRRVQELEHENAILRSVLGRENG